MLTDSESIDPVTQIVLNLYFVRKEVVSVYL